MQSPPRRLRRSPPYLKEYVRGGNTWMSATVHGLSDQLHPLLTRVSQHTVNEFPDLPRESEEAPSTSDYRQFAHEHTWAMSLHTILEFNVETVLTQLFLLADSLGSQQESDMLRHVREAAEEAGNVVHVDMSDPWEAYIAALEAAEIDFDENGESNMSLVAHPSFTRRLMEVGSTPEQEARIDAIMQMKREESRAARSRRRLS